MSVSVEEQVRLSTDELRDMQEWVGKFEENIHYANLFFKAAVKEEWQAFFLYECGCKLDLIEIFARKGRALAVAMKKESEK